MVRNMKIYIFIGLFEFAFAKFLYPGMDEDYFDHVGNPYENPNFFPYISPRSSDEDESYATSHELTEARNPMENENLFEGDILTRPLERIKEYGNKRNGLPRDNMRWENGVIPYVIDEALYNVRSLILSAMQHISSLTCISFVERTNEVNYVLLHMGSGCTSEWGRVGGKQHLSLAHSGCHFFGTIVHELMHTIGFMHEHSRTDRDNYLTIHWENIRPSDKHNFKLLSPAESRLFGQFDTKSMMLYGSYTFAYPGKYSMTSKDGGILPEVASKQSLSDLDVIKIKTLYQCN